MSTPRVRKTSRPLRALAALALCTVVATSCSRGAGSGAAVTTVQGAGVAPTAATMVPVPTIHAVTQTVPSADAEVTDIVLDGDEILVEGGGTIVDGTALTIVAAGTYRLSGTLADGQVRVDSDDAAPVHIILDGVDLTCSTSAPLYVVNAAAAVIELADGSTNRLADGADYVLEDVENAEPSGALFSKSDLTILGGGTLTVEAAYRHGIVSKDGLAITGGDVVVRAAADGIRGRDYVAITAGQVTVVAGQDGIQSSNDEDPALGYVLISGGVVDVTAGADGIQAETTAAITGGEVTLATGGGSGNASTGVGAPGNTWGRWPGGPATTASVDTPSAKGIKGVAAVTITGGSVTIDASDDAVHSNGQIEISDGVLNLASGDDGVHADASLAIRGGQLAIAKSYEGIESAQITIDGGTLDLTASDDGINVAGGSDASSLAGRPGQNAFNLSGDQYLHINGGTVAVDGSGDGIDVNGAIVQTGGTVLVNGPTSDMNGAIDYDAGYQMTGGTLVAAGSAGMAQAPDTSSTQNAVMIGFPSAVAAGTEIRIVAADGHEVVAFTPLRTAASLVVCSPDLQSGATYTVTTGGADVAEFTIAGTVTYVGSAPGRGGGGGRRRP